ncbi:MAG: YdcF family protein [Candidatus Saccharimonadaceae bacterium]
MYKKAVVVLGCGIDGEGNLNEDAMNSVRLGIESLGNSLETCLIMTGCISYKATFKPSISEAQAMKDYAVSLGIGVERIFVETESKDTLGNFFFTKQNLLFPLGINTITIVRGPNQSNERINYLASKILGKRYTFEIVVPLIERPNEQDREQKSLALAKKWLDSISDGDMDVIYNLMRSKHPAYNSSLGLESIKELL